MKNTQAIASIESALIEYGKIVAECSAKLRDILDKQRFDLSNPGERIAAEAVDVAREYLSTLEAGNYIVQDNIVQALGNCRRGLEMD
jgi:hypothetical protein